MRLFSIVGTRPEFIQSSTVYHATRAHSVPHYYIHTGQHYDSEMSLTFWEQLDLGTPDYELDIGSHSQGIQTGLILSKLDAVFADAQLTEEDWILVYGDTNSVLAGSLAAAKCPAGLAHIEAGIRSGDWGMPEEVNRTAADHLCDLALAPCYHAADNLITEGVPDERVVVIGDTIRAAYEKYVVAATLGTKVWEDLDIEFENYILVTIHRPENTDDKERLRRIVRALQILRQRGHQLVIPLHPRVDKRLFAGLPTISPVDYFDMLALETGAKLVITDSGGVQREAYYSRVPCVVLRNTTEWREIIRTGWANLVPPFSSSTHTVPIHLETKVMADQCEERIGVDGSDVDVYPALNGTELINRLKTTRGKQLH